jgi:Holliday junction resolvase RusA-like endonuclease
MRQVIHGNCPSKSNCYRIDPKGALYKSRALLDYEKSFYIQCGHYRNKNIGGYFEIYLDVFYPSQRSDLDNSLKIILDCLQRARAVSNDNKCVKIVANKFLDKKAPRIEFELKEV